MCDTVEQQLPPGETYLGRLATQCGWGRQVPSSEVPQIAKDVFWLHSE